MPNSVDEMASLARRQQDSRRDPDEIGGAPPVRTDGVIAGHHVIRLLGTGDRAVVYLGHSGTGSTVALKVFHADTEPASIELDITVLSSAAAPGLVRLLDVAQLGDGRICLVQERLAGGSLARYLVDHPNLSPGEAVTLLAPVTVGLDAMHAAGFAHGNVNQATILLDGTGRAVLAGLGAVRQFRDEPREQMRLLRADYECLGLVLEILVDAVDETHAHHAGGTALLRRFRAAVNPTRGRSGTGPADAGAHFGSVLATLEHDLFDWADGEPLRGFYPAARPEANARADDTVETSARHVNSARLRDGLIRPPELSTAWEPNLFEPAVAASEKHSDDDPAVGSRSGRFGHGSDAIRRLPGQGADLARGPHPLARLGRALATVVDSHPITAVGHALRQRLHGYQRPVLVAIIGGASILVLALTLLPASEPAGESGRASERGREGEKNLSGNEGSTDTPPATARVPADVPADAAGPADAGADASTGQSDAQPGLDGFAAGTDITAIAGDDPVLAVLALLARRATCLAAESLVCLVDVDQTGSAMLASDSYDARERQQGGSGQTFIDYADYVPSLAERSGDLAVVALTPAPGQEKGQPASVLVVKGEGGWRLREIFDY